MFSNPVHTWKEKGREGGPRRRQGGGQFCRYFHSHTMLLAMGMWTKGCLLSLLLWSPSIPLLHGAQLLQPRCSSHSTRPTQSSQLSCLRKGKNIGEYVQIALEENYVIKYQDRCIHVKQNCPGIKNLIGKDKSLKQQNWVSKILAESDYSIKEDLSNKSTNISKT